MPALEKRRVERSNNILIVNFRQFNKSREYLSGIANNYSHEGISFEAACIEARPGEVLELRLINPYSELSVSAIGEMVWKIDGWYKCMTGIRLKEVDREAIDKVKGHAANTIRVEDGPPSLIKEQERPKEEDNKDIVAVDRVVDEIAAEAAIMPPDDKALSMSNEEVDLHAEEKDETNQCRHRTDNFYFKIIKGLLLAATAIFVLMTLNERHENDGKINNTGQARAAAVTGQLTLENEPVRPVSSQNAVTAVINTKTNPGNNKKADNPEQAQDSAAARQLPLLEREIIFDSDSDIISPVYYSVIDKFVKELLKDPGTVLKVEGYSDSVGAELYNLDLAMRRAWEVKKLLMKKGINERRIKVTVYGESYPVSSDIDELDNTGDRRVTMVIVPPSLVSGSQ